MRLYGIGQLTLPFVLRNHEIQLDTSSVMSPNRILVFMTYVLE